MLSRTACFHTLTLTVSFCITIIKCKLYPWPTVETYPNTPVRHASIMFDAPLRAVWNVMGVKSVKPTTRVLGLAKVTFKVLDQFNT